ncbi:hypothetical protein [Streptomyces radicis]|nr:hypothetical protein [Streptomyces radicis]
MTHRCPPGAWEAAQDRETALAAAAASAVGWLEDALERVSP